MVLLLLFVFCVFGWLVWWLQVPLVRNVPWVCCWENDLVVNWERKYGFVCYCFYITSWRLGTRCVCWEHTFIKSIPFLMWKRLQYKTFPFHCFDWLLTSERVTKGWLTLFSPYGTYLHSLKCTLRTLNFLPGFSFQNTLKQSRHNVECISPNMRWWLNGHPSMCVYFHNESSMNCCETSWSQ